MISSGTRRRRNKFKTLWDNQQGICYYCKRNMTWKQRGYRSKLALTDATFDHKLPRSKGGTGHSSNLVLCCYECNQKKSDNVVFMRRSIIFMEGR